MVACRVFPVNTASGHDRFSVEGWRSREEFHNTSAPNQSDG